MPPKGGIRARPAARLGRGLRRPAAAPGGGAAGPPRLRSISGADWLAKGLTVFSGLYWDQPSKWVGRVVRLTSEELEPYLVVSVEGTQSEALLKYISGSERKELKVHLCGDPCEALRWQDGLAHLESIEEVPVPLEGWMQNLVAVKGTPGEGVDELEKVRKESVEAAQKRLEEVEKERQEKDGDGKKAKKKEKRRRSSSSSRKDRLKVKSRKGLGELFSHTGLDPDVRTRKRFLRKARKKMKKRKRGARRKVKQILFKQQWIKRRRRRGHGGFGEEQAFHRRQWSQELAEELPGTLSAGWLLAVQDHLLLHRGEVEEEEEGRLPTVATRYVRQVLLEKMSPPMRRESLNLGRALDLLLAGRPSECADVLVQRLKALELVATGVHFSIANKVELIGSDRSYAAAPSETLDAARRAAAEEKLVQKTSKGATRWDNPPPKGDGKGKKGDGKKGKQKDGKQKGDAKGGAKAGEKDS